MFCRILLTVLFLNSILAWSWKQTSPSIHFYWIAKIINTLLYFPLQIKYLEINALLFHWSAERKCIHGLCMPTETGGSGTIQVLLNKSMIAG